MEKCEGQVALEAHVVVEILRMGLYGWAFQDPAQRRDLVHVSWRLLPRVITPRPAAPSLYVGASSVDKLVE